VRGASPQPASLRVPSAFGRAGRPGLDARAQGE
jgi:hypothetical protein